MHPLWEVVWLRPVVLLVASGALFGSLFVRAMRRPHAPQRPELAQVALSMAGQSDLSAKFYHPVDLRSGRRRVRLAPRQKFEGRTS